MKRKPRVGDVGELSFVVEAAHAIDFADQEMPAVLSTPWLIWFLEHSSREAMLPLLDDGESTVGVSVDVRHLAPTPLGQRVSCRSRVINVDGRIVTFQMEASDEVEVIARGVHRLSIIDKARFNRRVQAKSSEAET